MKNIMAEFKLFLAERNISSEMNSRFSIPRIRTALLVNKVHDEIPSEQIRIEVRIVSGFLCYGDVICKLETKSHLLHTDHHKRWFETMHNTILELHDDQKRQHQNVLLQNAQGDLMKFGNMIAERFDKLTLLEFEHTCTTDIEKETGLRYFMTLCEVPFVGELPFHRNFVTIHSHLKLKKPHFSMETIVTYSVYGGGVDESVPISTLLDFSEQNVKSYFERLVVVCHQCINRSLKEEYYFLIEKNIIPDLQLKFGTYGFHGMHHLQISQTSDVWASKLFSLEMYGRAEMSCELYLQDYDHHPNALLLDYHCDQPFYRIGCRLKFYCPMVSECTVIMDRSAFCVVSNFLKAIFEFVDSQISGVVQSISFAPRLSDLRAKTFSLHSKFAVANFQVFPIKRETEITDNFHFVFSIQKRQCVPGKVNDLLIIRVASDFASFDKAKTVILHKLMSQNSKKERIKTLKSYIDNWCKKHSKQDDMFSVGDFEKHFEDLVFVEPPDWKQVHEIFYKSRYCFTCRIQSANDATIISNFNLDDVAEHDIIQYCLHL
jgi:hypothetical protein